MAPKSFDRRIRIRLRLRLRPRLLLDPCLSFFNVQVCKLHTYSTYSVPSSQLSCRTHRHHIRNADIRGIGHSLSWHCNLQRATCNFAATPLCSLPLPVRLQVGCFFRLSSLALFFYLEISHDHHRHHHASSASLLFFPQFRHAATRLPCMRLSGLQRRNPPCPFSHWPPSDHFPSCHGLPPAHCSPDCPAPHTFRLTRHAASLSCSDSATWYLLPTPATPALRPNQPEISPSHHLLIDDVKMVRRCETLWMCMLQHLPGASRVRGSRNATHRPSTPSPQRRTRLRDRIHHCKKKGPVLFIISGRTGP